MHILILLLLLSVPLGAEVINEATFNEVLSIAADLKIPRSVAVQLMMEESQGNPKAKSRMVKGYRSRGLYQIYEHPKNLNELLNKFWYPHLDGHVGEDKVFTILDPIENATLGLRYLAALHHEWGSWYEALLFYNAGTVRKAPKETKEYARRIVNAK